MAGHRCAWHPLGEVEVGSEVSMLVYTENQLSCTIGGHQIVQSTSEFPPGKLAALHAWTLTKVSDHVLTVESSPRSILVELPTPDPVDFFRCSEVCAGLGGTSIGAQFAGVLPLIALDHTDLACDFLRQNQHSHVLQGDLHCLHDLGRFH